MSYRKEATIRVIYFSAAALLSLLIALVGAAIISKLFTSHYYKKHSLIFNYSFLGIFAVSCATAVYQIDKILNDKFNKNP